MRYPLPALLFLLPLPAIANASTALLEAARPALLALPADGRTAVTVPLPLPSEGASAFTLVDSRTLPRDLMRRYPALRSYRGIDGEGRVARLDYAAGSVMYSVREPDGTWAAEQRAHLPSTPGVSPPTVRAPSAAAPSPAPRQRRSTSQGALRYDFRLALAADARYVATHGGTRETALAAMAHHANRANEVLENDLGVHLTLAGHTDRLIVTQADGDPLGEGEPRTAAAEFIRQRLPARSYDLGHAFIGLDGGETDTGTVCSDALDADYLATHKAAAWSGGADEPGAFSNFLLVLANQLGAPFRDTRCWQCLAFDGASIARVRQWLASRGGGCADKRLVDAMAPWVDPDSLAEPRAIPAHTPFWLDATVQAGTPGRTLTYAWDDIGFEPQLPSQRPSRTLRREITHDLPTAAGWLDFRLTVRDNGGPDATVASGDTHYQVVDTGRPFAMEPVTDATAGAPLAIRWDPAGTTLAPLSCHFLDALLSRDGGTSWQTIGTDIRNTGSDIITLPADATTDAARLRLACDWRPFFAEAPAPFPIH